MNILKISILALATFLIILFGCNNSREKKLQHFGEIYAEAWSSQKPEKVATFFTKDGSLQVNKNSPVIGRAAITSIAEGFMTAFPDMVVTMDSLRTTANGITFYWTLAGINSGPGGTGNSVCISGVERWRLNKNGLIMESIGSFDAAEYSHQLKYGVNH